MSKRYKKGFILIKTKENPLKKIKEFFKYLGFVNSCAIFVILIIIIGAIFDPPGNPFSQILTDRLISPLSYGDSGNFYILGTDSLGRDLFSRVIYGCRVSMIVGVLGVGVALFIGVPLGLIAGYFGGKTNIIFSRLADIQLSIPYLLFAIAIMATVGTGLFKVILVLGVARWATFYRITRGEVLSLKNEEYVINAEAFGASSFRVILRHLLPNIVSPIIVAITFGIADAILAEAGLSYLGLGVPPSFPSWGLIVREGKDFITSSWWISTFGGLAIMTFVLSINLLGDKLRDFLDPKISKYGVKSSKSINQSKIPAK
jgi:peptide/nickel transport system permease protein